MARTKNYQANPVRRKQARAAGEAPGIAGPIPSPDGARIDMVALLGPETRFAAAERNLDLGEWLGRGIDAWVWAAVGSLRAILLSGTRQTSTVTGYATQLRHFFAYLTDGRQAPLVATPADLSPLHIEAYIGWLQDRARQSGWTGESTRAAFKHVKAILLEMFTQGLIPGEPTRFFRRGALTWRSHSNRHTSLSDREQERLAQAIKADLVAVHHGRLRLKPAEVQALRLLLIAHRQGANPAPLLELRRDAMAPGALPGTIRILTVKHRSKKIRFGVGRASPDKVRPGSQPEVEMVFSLAEGAVLQQAITSTQELVDEAPQRYRNRVWLYRSQGSSRSKKGSVSTLKTGSLKDAISALIKRHQLLGDDGHALRLNLSRLRKSYFDRVMRISDGDLVVTANLMGNSPQVAAANYPSMNEARKSEAAGFMNEDYTAVMLGGAGNSGGACAAPQVIKIKPLKAASGSLLLQHTPVSLCKDTLNGEHAPRDGHNHCDRYVMCLFCASFAIVGSIDELWRLFSFQAFAKSELEHLDATLGLERTGNDVLEDLRDRYRLAIAYIDDFTQRQFPARNVRQARAKTDADLHPFWIHQITASRRARARLLQLERDPDIPLPGGTLGDYHGS